MSTTLLADDTSSLDLDRSIDTAHALVAGLVLTVLMAINIPLFLRMPLATDTALYDFEASAVSKGYVAYQDFFETNLPGVIWIHSAVRAVAGPSWLALRAFDLVMLACLVLLLVRFLRSIAPWTPALMWTALMLFAFYLSMSEWCHVQRDTWALLPVMGAVTMRARQIMRMASDAPWRPTVGFALLEGLCWGAAVWIKPMMVVPALACWTLSAVFVRRPRALLLDLFGLLMGGSLLGGLGVLWLWNTGAWPAFVETFTEWNPQYFAAGRENWTFWRLLGMCWRMFPWTLLHLVALPIAIRQLWVGLRPAVREMSMTHVCRMLLATLYVAWVAQSVLLQHLFDYTHMPGVLLAIVVIAGTAPLERRRSRLAVLGFCLAVAATTTLFDVRRLEAWSESVRGPSTPELYDRLARLKQVEWQHLDNVATFLAKNQVADGELTCFNSTLIYLYDRLNVYPSTRQTYLDCMLTFCSSFAPQMLEDWQRSGQRWLVLDLVESGYMVLGEPASTDAVLPPGVYPGLSSTESTPPAFRAGRYAVYTVGQAF